MAKYLGEEIVNIKDDPYFSKYTEKDWAMEYIERYGQIDGDHHKAWVLDQVARILKGTEVILKIARWDNGLYEYRITTNSIPSLEYNLWVEEMLGEEVDGEREYSYDEGIAP